MLKDVHAHNFTTVSGINEIRAEKKDVLQLEDAILSNLLLYLLLFLSA